MISDAQFKQAVHIINNPPKSGWGNAPPKIDRFKIDVQELLERDIARPSDDRINLQSHFYGLYKQATEGDNHTPRPGFLDFVGKSEWNAWKALEGTSKGDAQRMYVEATEEVLRRTDSPEAKRVLAELMAIN